MQVFERGQVAAAQLEGALAEEGHLFLFRQVVDLARVILAASATAGGDGQRRPASCGSVGIAGQALAAIRGRIKVVAWEGGAAGTFGHAHAPLGKDAGFGELAVLRGQHILLVVVDHAENIVAVRIELAEARRQVEAVFAAPLVLGRDDLGRDVGDIDRALGDEVDHAADGVRAVDGRGAVAQYFDALQRGDGDDVEVDAGAVIRMVGDAPAVEQHQRLVAAQAAQVGAGLAARGQAAGVAADGIAATHAGGIRGDLAEDFLGGGQTLLGKVFGLEDGERGGCFRYEPLDGGPGDFNSLHAGGVAAVLRQCRLAEDAGGKAAGADQTDGTGQAYFSNHVQDS